MKADELSLIVITRTMFYLFTECLVQVEHLRCIPVCRRSTELRLADRLTVRTFSAVISVLTILLIYGLP